MIDGYEITSLDLDEIYKLCDDDLSSKTVMLEDEEGALKYNFFAFEKKPAKPTFCEEPVFEEIKTGYFLIVYNKQYAAIFRHNFSKLGSLSKNLIDIDYQDFIDSDVNSETEFKYLNMKNLDGSDYAIKKKTYEGNDLKKSISAFSSSKYYVQSMRGENKDGKKFSINFATSRLNHYLRNKTIGDILDWVEASLERIKENKRSDEKFLENFAKRSLYSTYYNLTPSILLVCLEFIYRILENGEVRIFNKGTECNDLIVDDLSEFKKVKKIKKRGDEYYVECGRFKVNVVPKNNHIDLECDEWKKITISGSENGEYDGNLEQLVNRLKLFSVYFVNDSRIYTNGYLFEDSKLLGNIDWLLEYVHDDVVDVGSCVCEKIQGEMSAENFKLENGWNYKSEFYVIEEAFKKEYTTVICDDLNSEWADFIGIKKDQIEFCACKYKGNGAEVSDGEDGSSSASYFQDVVGQALKNLGNFKPSPTQLKIKTNLWKSSYLGVDWFSRCRKGDVDKSISAWDKGVSNPHFVKISSLMVNFLSKQTLKDNFEGLKAGGINNTMMKDRESAYQQLWILSNFVHSCLEMGIEPRIYCRK